MNAPVPRRRDQAQIALDLGLARLAREARLLPALTPENAAEERARLVALFDRGQRGEPRWKMPKAQLPRDAGLRLDKLRRVALRAPASSLYLAKLEELELDLTLLEARGEPKLVRPLAARRFGHGRDPAPGLAGCTLSDVARRLLADNPADAEPKTVPARASQRAAGATSLEALVLALAERIGMEIDVKVSPRLMSNAAAGEHTVFLADRSFGLREALRLAVHEVMGHLVAAFNGRAQPLGIFALGTAGSFADQEGMCITLEERSGLLDADRVRTFAARVLVTDWVHDGASFAETVMRLMRDYDFAPLAAVCLAERGHRGGGVARDAVYLRSWMRVRRATDRRRGPLDPESISPPRPLDTVATVDGTKRQEARGAFPLDLLRIGKVGVDDAGALRELAQEGWVRLRPPFLTKPPATYLPSLLSNRVATGGGTSLEMSPPNLQTSFTSPDAT